MLLAILGGTFDPIHEAHLALGRAALTQVGLDKVLFVPASQPPHKSGVTHAGYEHRVRMAQLACAGEPHFEVSRLEEDTTSYSIETITKVRAQLKPGDELFFIIGADAFAEIETWRRWREVVAATIFIVASRPGHVYRIPEGAKVERLESVDLPYSSSAIRSALAAGKSPVGIPRAVLDYIRRNGLYGVRTPAP